MRENPLFDGYVPGRLCGMNVTLQEDLVEQRRTWRERFLSWPWQPWISHRWVENPIIKRGEVLHAGNSLIMRRSTYQEMQQRIDQ